MLTPQNTTTRDGYFFFVVFFGAAFLVAFLVFTFGSPLSMDEKEKQEG